MREALASTKTFAAERTLQLWIYGHIVEASEPYEILMKGRLGSIRIAPTYFV